MSHTEVPIQVNAWVDSGVAPLVSALNRFPLVITLDSCEGDPDGHAYVHFGYRGSGNDLAAFVGRLSSEMGKRLRADEEYSLRIEWVAGAVEPMATLYARRDYVEPLARAFENLAVNMQWVLLPDYYQNYYQCLDASEQPGPIVKNYVSGKPKG